MEEELDIKLAFEREVSDLLKKYVIKSENALIQKAEILVGIAEVPTIKLEIKIFNK